MLTAVPIDGLLGGRHHEVIKRAGPWPTAEADLVPLIMAQTIQPSHSLAVHCSKVCQEIVLLPAVLDDGLLDVAYIMNYPREQVPGLLMELVRGRDEGDNLELMDCFGSMRVQWLEVHCAAGLQVCTINP